MTRIDDIISGLASRQHGLASRTQLRLDGVSPSTVRYRVRTGRLHLVTDEVVKVAGAPTTEASRLMSAVLDAGSGSAVSHQSAAARWGLPGFRIDPVSVTGRRGRARRRNDDVVVHEPRKLLQSHIIEVDSVPITTPTRAIFDLAGQPTVHPKRLARLLDTAWSRNLVSHASLTAMLRCLARRGRPGITVMRQLLDDRPADHRPPDSNNEARFQELAVAVGLTRFERQRDVGGDDAWIGRVDFFDRSRGVVVEVVDALFHGSLTDRRADEARWGRLSDAGLQVEVVDGFDLFHRADDVRARLATLR